MESLDRCESSDSIDVISLESKSSIQTLASKASYLIQNLPQNDDESNVQDIERLNKLVKLNDLHSLKATLCRPNFCRSNCPQNFPVDDLYDSGEGLTSTLKNYFYKYILFKCFQIQLPSDD